MAKRNFQIKDILEFQPKSTQKSRRWIKESGTYPFFTSSQSQTKWFDEADYKMESIILGTGGAPSVHNARKLFDKR